MDWDALKHVRDLRLLAGMQRQACRDLLSISTVLDFQARSVILKEASPAAHLHVVLEGCVELYGSSQKKEASMALLEPGEPFILAAVIKKAPVLLSARAIQRSRVLFIPAEAFRTAMRADPGLAHAVTDDLGTDFRKMVRQLRNQKLRSGKQRLAAYLLQLQREQGRPGEFCLDIKKRTLASLLGLEPETLSRVFAELRTEGVETQGDQIIVRDVVRLEQFVGADWRLDDPNG